MRIGGIAPWLLGGIDAPHYFENIFILAAGGGILPPALSVWISDVNTITLEPLSRCQTNDKNRPINFVGRFFSADKNRPILSAAILHCDWLAS